jgi:hypothetical protein
MALSSKIKLIVSICAFLSTGGNVCHAQFNGGNGSGIASVGITNSVCSVTTINAFGGGSGNGASTADIINSVCTVSTLNAFGGGNGDGYSNLSIINSACVVTTLNAFGGGSGSGYSSSSIINSACVVTTLNAFGGGAADGYGNVGLTNSVCVVTTLNAFGGGGADGFGHVEIINNACNVTTLNVFSGGSAGGSASVAELVLDHSSCVTLPIELVYFIATLDDNRVILEWQTATETNNDYFTIEKSSNGTEFEEVAIIKGAGYSSSYINYSFIDDRPYFGTSYYRLKQTDYDWKFTYSKLQVVNLEIDFASTLAIYPNPILGKSFIVEMDQPICQDLNIEIEDLTGKMILEQDVCLDAARRIELTLQESPASGIYIVTISCEHFSVMKKIIFR